MTLFVAGPLFLIIMMVVMGMMGGSAVVQLVVVTYAIMPIGSFIFVLMIDLISLKAEKTSRYVKTKWLRTYADVTLSKKINEGGRFEQLEKYDRISNIIYYIRNPLETFINDVNRSLYVTVPLNILYMTVMLMHIPRYRHGDAHQRG